MKVKCHLCGRTAKDNPGAKAHHMLKYHPEVPFYRLITMFGPQQFEAIGARIGNALKAWTTK